MIKKTDILGFIGIVVAISVTAALLFFYKSASASLSTDTLTISNVYRIYDLFASTTAETTVATSTAATSTNIASYINGNGVLVNGTADIRGAKKIVLYFSEGGISHANTGTSTFSIQVSPDGVLWQNFNRLVSDSATSATALFVSSVQLPPAGSPAPATSTVDYYMDPSGGYQQLRCIDAMTGTTEGGCKVGVTY